jgi:hypothetical protein
MQACKQVVERVWSGPDGGNDDQPSNECSACEAKLPERQRGVLATATLLWTWRCDGNRAREGECGSYC